MKKIGGKSFWIILVISIISLIILAVGTLFLTRKSSKEFYSAGYIINSTATESNKLYFNDNTVYKENVFNEYVFKDVDNKEVSTDKNNFIHYLDNSLSFMKNGVILDLDNINTTLIPYYNITDESIIKYNNGGYYIESSDKTLIFGNFLGRITDNKYIVVGKDIKIKLAGSNETVSGNYFEILFIEDGVVRIENQEGSYQTVSDGTTIYVGNDVKIDLGDKSVIKGEEVKLSLSEMTIDGNENIDITPDNGKVKGEDKDNSKDNNGNSSDNNPSDGSSAGNEGNITNGNGDQGETTQSVIKKEVSVDLITAKVGISTIEASFQVIDTADYIKGNLLLTLVNSDTGKTVYEKTLVNSSDIQSVNISSLTPDANYVMTISGENNVSSVQYFKKIFKTDSLDLSLVREYVTTDSLSYYLDFGTSLVKSANISLYGEDGKQIGNMKTILNDNNDVILFEGLEKNTTYNVKVDSVVFNNLNNADVYTISTSDITLKEKPKLGDISVKVSDDGKEFSLLMDEPEDSDKSIVRYTYEIYKAIDITEDNITSADPVYSFSDNELKQQKLKLGENGIVSNVDYRFKVIVDYYDNYKYNQIDTGFSNYFQVLGKPTVSFTINEEETSFNQISGTVIINDEGCTVPNSGRSCFDQENEIIIKYYGPDKIKKSVSGVSFDPNNMSYNLKLGGLAEDTMYTFEVYADVDMQTGLGLQNGMYIGSFSASTKGTKALKMQNWKSNNYSFETPISVNTEMISTDPDDDSVSEIASITFNLYNGNVKNSIITEPIGSFTTTGNIKELYYNKEFTLTSNMFGIENLDMLRELSGGKLSKYYTIEVTDAFDATNTNQFVILDNMYVFETPSILLLEDEVSSPQILVDEITNTMTSSGEYSVSYDNKLDKNTIRGYKVTAVFDKDKINNVLKLVDNPIRSIKFYAYDKSGKIIDTKDVSYVGTDINETYFFLDYGTDISIDDTDMRRGNSYKFGFEINLDTDNDGKADSVYPSNRPISNLFNAVKRDPVFKMYVDNSTSDSITYKYSVTDIDNALVKDNDSDKYLLYYSINDNVFSSVIEKTDEFKDVTFGNLSASDIYTISYSRANLKDSEVSNVTLNKFYFDGYHDGKIANMGYELEYGNFDNRLKIIIDDNEFLDRVSAYLLTLSAGSEKYEKVISSFTDSDIQSCGDRKCFIIDYKDIANFKGKDVKVSLKAFYDTGYIGFSQKSKIGSYFEQLGLVSAKDAEKVGFVYQANSISEPGSYIYIKDNGSNIVFYNSTKPMGILSSSFDKSSTMWKLTTNNMIDIDKQKFVSFGDINKVTDNFTPILSGIYEANVKYINLKVLDMVDIQTSDNNFKFTSITPKVSSKANSLINGAVFNINLSVDEDTLNSDFVKTDGKYKFYIDIYKKTYCDIEDSDCVSEEVLVKTEETDYDNLNEVTVIGLDPDSEYYYKISADMNKNGTKVKTPLFDYNVNGYVEYKDSFKTLNKDGVLKELSIDVTSSIGEDVYSKRILNLKYVLKTNVNFDILYEIYDINDEMKYQRTILNDDFNINSKGTITASYGEDISGNDFVFGSNYYTLKVYAVTTDLNKKLELFNDKIKQSATSSVYIDFPELKNPDIKVDNQEAIIESSSSGYKHSIKYKISINDSHRVINDGKYMVELQNSSYQNACSNVNDCLVEVDIKNNTCNFKNGKTCTVLSNTNSGQVIEITFDNLNADTKYVIYAYADTYRNNVSLSESEKSSRVHARKDQYTKSDLGFSLGAVTPTAVSNNKVLLTFVGAANLTSSLKGIEYSITVQGGERIASGVIGKVNDTDPDNIVFTLDSDNFPYLTIDIPDGKELGVNNTINISYYYVDKDGNLTLLKLGDSTVFDIQLKIENKQERS